jgi:hypothetical protein
MAGKYQVWSTPRELDGGARLNHPCLDTKQEAKKFISDAEREHPDRIYEYEECSHPEHQAQS